MASKQPLAEHHYRKRRHRFLLTHTRCAACGSEGPLELDHIIPRMLGGSVHDPANWQALCARCNRTRGSSGMSLDQLRAYRAAHPPRPKKPKPIDKLISFRRIR